MTQTLERAWARRALTGGLVAGIAFVAFEMVASAVLMGVDAAFLPLRMIAGIMLGAQALNPTYPLISVLPITLVVHLILSMAFALIFVAVLQPTSALRSTTTLLLSTSIYGLVLWLVNFYVIAPIMGWGWFADETNPLVQFLAHTFFYGWILGAWLGRRAVIEVGEPHYEAEAGQRRT
jgi:hypothetical protein